MRLRTMRAPQFCFLLAPRLSSREFPPKTNYTEARGPETITRTPSVQTLARSVPYKTYARPDSFHPALGLRLDSARNAKELLLRPVVARRSRPAPGAMVGCQGPVAGFDG